MSASDRRKALHAATGLLALLLRDASLGFAVALAGLLVLHNLLVLPRWAPSLMRSGRPRPDVGVVTYPLLVLGLVLVFRDRLELAAAAWGILAFGDGAAGPVGRRSSRALPWNPEKTWAGSLAFLVAGTVAGAVLLRWVADPAPGLATALGVAASGAALAAVLESLRVRLDDNPRLVLGAAVGLALGSSVDPARAAAAAPEWLGRLGPVTAASVVLAGLALAEGSVGRSGALVGALLVILLGVFGGVGAVLVFATFFVLGSGATRLGRRIKEERGLAQPRRGRRGASHALANVGVATLLTIAAATADRPTGYLVGMAAALATAAFDTVATEIGQAWGRRTVSPRTGRPVPPGTPGAVSLIGSAAGAGAALAVVAVAVATELVPASAGGIVLAAAALGAFAESLAGSIPAVRESLDGGTLNLLNTALGAGGAMLLFRFTGV